MRVAIRDDDTNFFTTPEQLEACYRDIWHTVPPTLFLISKIKGNWQEWVHRIYREKQQTDWQAWQADNIVYPVEQNKPLIFFLKEKIKEGLLDVGFHAIHHRNEDAVLPVEKTNNYIRGAEFYTTRDLTDDIRRETTHLSQLLDYPLSVFSPPQNLLSLKGYRAVINTGLNLCGGGISFIKKQKGITGWRHILQQAVFRLRYKHHNYPYILQYPDHAEIPYHYPLQPNTKLETLIHAFEMVRRFDGDFVLSTHYVEFNYPMTYEPKKSMKNVLEEFLNYAGKYNDITYCTVSEMLNNKQRTLS